MRHSFLEIKNNLDKNISHQLFNDSDISISSAKNKTAADDDTVALPKETGLVFTYPNVLFISQTGKWLTLKKEVIEKFNFETFVESKKQIKDIDNTQFVRINDTDAFYSKLYSIATELFLFYLNRKELSHFGCCNSRVECSNIGYCINKNKELFCGCDYRRNLEKGNNFYKEH